MCVHSMHVLLTLTSLPDQFSRHMSFMSKQGFSLLGEAYGFTRLCLYYLLSVDSKHQCFDAVGWVAGRASGL